ncbi:MAG: FecR family protein [Candidatus Cryptobacteroides sp.]
MTNLIEKYTKGLISAKELEALREADEAAVSEAMEKDWNGGNDAAIRLDERTMKRMKREIDRRSGNRNGRRQVMAWFSMAAAVLLPLLIGSTIFLFIQNRSISSNITSFSTGPGEQADIVLPDGSRVTLNSESELKYTTGKFNNGKREIDFNGEGYFEISHNADKPFTVNAKRMSVTVLGTVFCMQVRDHRKNSEISLEEGKVLVKSLKNGQEAMLLPEQRLTMDNATGIFKITSDRNIADKSSWTRGEITFHGDSFSKVIETLEDVFGVRISIGEGCDPDDIFSGTITTNNIHDALLVLEKSFHLKASINDRKVSLQNEQ